MDAPRRHFLHASGAMTAGALFPALAAWLPATHAQTVDYRALVCVFLYGGNDGNNTVVPYDDYANYAAGRSAAGGAALSRGELVPIAPVNLTRKYGLHPNLAPLAPLFEQRKLAVVCNAGTLVAPVTRAHFRAGQKHPRNLFSHSDQQLAWQGLVAGQPTASGWGGRLVDAIGGGNPARAIPGMVSLAGDALYTVGVSSLPVALSRFGSLGLPGIAIRRRAGSATRRLHEFWRWTERANSLHMHRKSWRWPCAAAKRCPAR